MISIVEEAFGVDIASILNTVLVQDLGAGVEVIDVGILKKIPVELKLLLHHLSIKLKRRSKMMALEKRHADVSLGKRSAEVKLPKRSVTLRVKTKEED